MEQIKPKVFSMGKEGWVAIEQPAGSIFYDRQMIKDGTGMIINMTYYPKGYWKPYHRHNLSHGIYVIAGKLKTDHGIYGPGTLVWHPEGYKGGHGATEEESCTFLFIGNKPFDIEFIEKKE